MTPPVSTPYTSVVSLRSRRYRILMTVLLATILLMGVYGRFSIMPKVGMMVDRPDTPELKRIATSQPSAGITAAQITGAKKTLRARRLEVSLALAYWGICCLLMICVIFLLWLDFRETTRNFALQAQALREETILNLRQDALRRNEQGDEEDG